MHNRLTHGVVPVMALATFAPWPAHAGCQDKVAEIDAALADTEIDPNVLNGIKMMRDQGAAMCAQGNEATAMQVLELVAMSLPQTRTQVAAEQESDADSKAGITNEFLAGTWCAIVDQEHSQYIFSVDGTYRGCVHDTVAGRYGHCTPPQPTSKRLARYERAKTVEQDTLVLGGNTSRTDDSTFKRGECSLYGR